MRILKNKSFHRWAKEVNLKDTNLINAIEEMAEGLYEANLGGHIYKKRISIGNKGKRGGARTIVAFKIHKRAIFIYGFAKNKKDTITFKEEEALKALAKVYVNYEENQINRAIETGELIEVKS
jgi:hypothetical protein